MRLSGMKIKLDARASAFAWTRECTCNRCKSVMEVSVGDLRAHSDQREGTSYYFACGVCKARVWLAVQFIPAYVEPHIKNGTL